MERSRFLKNMLGFAALGGLTSVVSLAKTLDEQDYTYPVLFIGHGSPMNGIQDNSFSRQWKEAVNGLPDPKMVLVISAHWLTRGTYVTAMEHPQTIHDFGGFPQELFDVQYPAPGSPEWAETIQTTVSGVNIGLDHDWGLDHGAWTVVKHMYPDARIPVLQLSIDFYQSGAYHYALAQELRSLRKKGVLIIGSGNMVHNLRMVAWDKMETPNYGYDWAIEAHETFNKLILERRFQELVSYEKLGDFAKLAIPTPDHYYPLLYTLGLSNKSEDIQLFNKELVAGSLNMTSVRFG